MNFDEMLAKAEAGSVPAQGIVGSSYLFGFDGVTQDYDEAFRWLTNAASAGAARPMVWLGTMYEQGLGVAADIDKARALYQRGAERGEFMGCIYLARLLASGRAGPVDEAGAAKWYRRALSLPGIDAPEELDEARQYVARLNES